ncbi:hypothetical protein BS50DRAFT_589714 [Corynespora cassiicola Philippines]|uniref:Uncharacterized protein n=1 Tax=Corynespora cassiicola Philippines TaxID=1448308 RepID=A0A2T2NIN6_CORCC|nr:hypothetical protein BS50DRAFT_589714 [Corynespora cassiicola Philippines]
MSFPPRQHTVPQGTQVTPQDIQTIDREFENQSLAPFLRTYFREANKPNFYYDPLMQKASRTLDWLDYFDSQPDQVHQLVFEIVNGINQQFVSIKGDRDLFLLIILRHYRHHGGLILPPLKPARDAQEAAVAYNYRVIYPNCWLVLLFALMLRTSDRRHVLQEATTTVSEPTATKLRP